MQDLRNKYPDIWDMAERRAMWLLDLRIDMGFDVVPDRDRHQHVEALATQIVQRELELRANDEPSLFERKNVIPNKEISADEETHPDNE